MSDRFARWLIVGLVAVLSIGLLSAVFVAEYLTIQAELHPPYTVKP